MSRKGAVVVPDSEGRIPPDGPMTAEQEALASLLSEDMLRQIDAIILSNTRTTWRKVAMVVGLTMFDPSLSRLELPDVFYSQRIRKLVDAGALEGAGNLDYMRYSEVRRPHAEA